MSIDEIISDLCKQSLIGKWTDTSTAYIFSDCAFCHEVNDRTLLGECKDCYCPPEICANKGKEGYIRKLSKKYDNIRVCNINDVDLKKMRSLFEKYIIE